MCVLQEHNLDQRGVLFNACVLTGNVPKFEVMSIIRRDEISEISQNDELIVALGEDWYQKANGNRLKRRH